MLEKHYVSSRSRREKAVLAFLVQDNDSRVLCYANATVRKDRAAEEIIEFVDFWEGTRGTRPAHLVFDSQLTTYAVLERLCAKSILFITLRRRGPALMRQLKELPAAAWQKMRLHGVSRRFRNVRYTEGSVVLRALSKPLRQIALCDLGHEEPTLFLTNDTPSPAAGRRMSHRYARDTLVGRKTPPSRSPPTTAGLRTIWG